MGGGGGPGGGAAAGSGRGFGRGPIGDYKCYQVCPPIVYPNGHDPYYDTPYYQYEKELHGGPFGPGTLNPYNTNDPKNYAGHWPGVKRPVPTRSLPQNYPDNHSPGIFGSLLQTSSSTSFLSQIKTSAYSNIRSQQSSQQTAQVHPKGIMCLHVCPKTPAARPDDEPFGGPFGPDPVSSNFFCIFFVFFFDSRPAESSLPAVSARSYLHSTSSFHHMGQLAHPLSNHDHTHFFSSVLSNPLQSSPFPCPSHSF